MEHAKRVAHHAGMIWVQTLDPQPDIQYNVQQSGVGSNEVTYGKYTGLTFLQKQQAPRS